MTLANNTHYWFIQLVNGPNISIVAEVKGRKWENRHAFLEMTATVIPKPRHTW